MFGRNEEKGKLAVQKAMTMFGQGTQLTGDVNSDGDIRVDGAVKGVLQSKAKIVIGVTGIVEGDLICQNATIEGKVNGNVVASDLVILTKSAFVAGDIQLKKLVVEEGARFSGKCSMGNLKVNRVADEPELAKAL
jgi:cytoskeletal protein CcmA (bactofilin family)